MSSVKIECPQCRRKYLVAEKLIGRKITCASETCGSTFLAALLPPKEPIEDIPLAAEDSKPRKKSERHEFEFPTSAPPIKKKRVNRVSILVPVICLASFLILVVIGLGVVFEMARGNKPNRNTASVNETRENPSDPAPDEMTQLLYFTDTTLRLLQVTGDADFAREYIDKWTAKRKSIQHADKAELSLDIIEGHLNEIHQRLYPRTDKWAPMSSALGWRDEHEFAKNEASEAAIRRAETQVMRSFNIPWTQTQQKTNYRQKRTKLIAECRRIGSISQAGKNGLPKPLTAVEATKLMRDIEILYADTPFSTEFMTEGRGADLFAQPASLDVSHERYYFDMAANLVYLRSHLPVFQDNLEGKTDALEFSEKYAHDLKHLEEMVH